MQSTLHLANTKCANDPGTFCGKKCEFSPPEKQHMPTKTMTLPPKTSNAHAHIRTVGVYRTFCSKKHVSPLNPINTNHDESKIPSNFFKTR